ncbi:NC domain protein [Zoogloea sp.]|uniref:NC domain protein n=1 Tax=Zoogloea sp. TaxID=49181 RepID=UPI001DAAC1A7|nr:NC domain protein [Zoogloea sp.]MBK6656403.1 NC domain protein [Zoogloea sp.]HOY02835.1 NC domain protein [Zoogloea sp.]
MFFNTQPIRIISRPKLTGLGEHWGVQLPDGNVAHLTPEGEQIVSFTEFAQGRPIKEVRRAAPEQRAQIMQRLSLSLQHRGPYRLLDRNCETYATWLLGEKPRSPQVEGVILLGVIAALLRFA